MSDETDEIFRQFGSLFGDLFGVGPPKPDTHRVLQVSLAEAANGTERSVEDTKHMPCPSCGGRGGPKNQKPSPCMSCEGKGQATSPEGSDFIRTGPCTFCHGTGVLWANPCAECDGRCTHTRPARWQLAVPPGTQSGFTMRLEGQGNDLGDGPGDAYFQIVVDAHPTLKRRGDDLLAKLSITEEIADTGGEVGLPWLDGVARVKVPAGATHGSIVKMVGWGAVRPGEAYSAPPEPGAPYRSGSAATRGDLIVTLLTHEEEDKDPYDVLGLAPGASPDAIITSYRRLVMAHHQDPNRDDPDALHNFEEVQEAYQRLVRPSAPRSDRGNRWATFALFLIAVLLLAIGLMR